jgi:hypothetical protein
MRFSKPSRLSQSFFWSVFFVVENAFQRLQLKPLWPTYCTINCLMGYFTSRWRERLYFFWGAIKSIQETPNSATFFGIIQWYQPETMPGYNNSRFLFYSDRNRYRYQINTKKVRPSTKRIRLVHDASKWSVHVASL